MSKDYDYVATFVGKYDFKCPNCGKVHHLSTYAIAQLASRHDLNFSCECLETLLIREDDFNSYKDGKTS